MATCRSSIEAPKNAMEAVAIGDGSSADIDPVLFDGVFQASTQARSDVCFWWSYDVDKHLFAGMFDGDREYPTYYVPGSCAFGSSCGLPPPRLLLRISPGACEALACTERDLRELIFWLFLLVYRMAAVIIHSIGACEPV